VTLSARKLGGTKINIVLNTSVRFVSLKYGLVYRVNVEGLDVLGENSGKILNKGYENTCKNSCLDSSEQIKYVRGSIRRLSCLREPRRDQIAYAEKLPDAELCVCAVEASSGRFILKLNMRACASLEKVSW